jgi:hypothetical protein
MLLGIQVLGILFALGLIYLVFLNYKRREFSKAEFLAWLFFWAVFIAITLFPRVLDKFTKTMSITRVMDLLTVLGLLFVTVLAFHNYVTVKKNANKLETVVRKIALAKAEEKKQ